MPYIFNKYYPVRNIVFFLGEGVLIFLSLLFVNWLFKGSVIFRLEIPECIQQCILVTIVFQLCLYFFDLYELRNDLSMPVTATRVTQAFGVGCIILGILYYTLPGAIIPTKIFWTGYFFIYLLLLAWRACYYYALKRRLFVQSIVVIGSGQLAADIAREIESRYDSPYRIVGFVGPVAPSVNPKQVPVYPDLSRMHDRLADHSIDRIVVALDDRRGATPVEQLLGYKLQGMTIEQGVSFYERLTGKIMVERVDPSWIIYSDGFRISSLQASGKRFVDIVIAVLLFVVTLPVMLLAALIIKMETPGPVFYKQERVGKRRRLFKVIKFRSMVQDAEKGGAVWAAQNDSRVTRFGALIRKTRIDELPQLINVLRGDMSLVGPRPERPVFVEQLKEKIPYYDIRHDIRPGVTGWAQVCYPYGASEEDALRKLEYDLYYMKHISIPLDLLVIFRTVKTVLCAKGGR